MAKQRSPNYPAIGLSDAVEAVKAIHDKERRTAVPAAVVAKALGYSSLSGPVRVKIAALKKYGLMEGDDASGGFRVSELALHILFPANGEQESASRIEAALKPELFADLYAAFKEGSDEAIRSYLITKLAFSPGGAKQAIAAFRDTLAFSGLVKSEYNASDMSDKQQAAKSGPAHNVASPSFAGFSFPNAASSAHAVPNNAWTWTLSIPRNVKAELRIAGDVTKADMVRLKKQIEFLESSFDEETEE
jgi:hypothetical protein